MLCLRQSIDPSSFCPLIFPMESFDRTSRHRREGRGHRGRVAGSDHASERGVEAHEVLKEDLALGVLKVGEDLLVALLAGVLDELCELLAGGRELDALGAAIALIAREVDMPGLAHALAEASDVALVDVEEVDEIAERGDHLPVLEVEHDHEGLSVGGGDALSILRLMALTRVEVSSQAVQQLSKLGGAALKLGVL